MRQASSVLLAALLVATPQWAETQEQASNVQQLLNELQDTNRSDNAAHQLKRAAQTDPRARKYLAEKLPGIIERSSVGSTWLNSVHLAGDLRIVEAAPALAKSLADENRGGPVTFAEELRLDDDPVGQALVAIGKAAVGPTGRMLENGNKATRWRAALILVKNDGTEAKQLLAKHLQRETDPRLREFIQSRLAVRSQSRRPASGKKG